MSEKTTKEALEREYAELKEKKKELAKQIALFSLDKDFSENFSVQASLEERGFIQKRVDEIEEELRKFLIPDSYSAEKEEKRVLEVTYLKIKVNVKSVALLAKEPNPTLGYVTAKSPLGKALSKEEGSIEKVEAPEGSFVIKILRKQWVE